MINQFDQIYRGAKNENLPMDDILESGELLSGNIDFKLYFLETW
jgi:hypothetical protein